MKSISNTFWQGFAKKASECLQRDTFDRDGRETQTPNELESSVDQIIDTRLQRERAKVPQSTVVVQS